MNNYSVVIMAGGIGSRFWPKSRVAHPKQFLDILGTGNSLLQATFKRFNNFVPAGNIYVITSAEYLDIARRQLPRIPAANILAEPERKNTAACIAYISFKLAAIRPGGSMIVAPADHLILDEAAFARVCRAGFAFVKNHKALLTLGIRPTYANTGFGYIHYDNSRLPVEDADTAVCPVRSFTEKPSNDVALQFLASGDYLWNAGIFIWKVEDIIAALREHVPDMYQAFRKQAKSLGTSGEQEAIRLAYQACGNVSIDVAVMEKAGNVVVIPASFGWSDLGTWNSAYENGDKDPDDNTVSGDDVLLFEARRCLVNAPPGKLLLVEGVEDLIIVDTADALLICRKESEQRLKEYVLRVRDLKGNKHL